ncbi:MAG: peptidylprolyl isomerase [Planctomycetes bacterium]|nr:peptidylprolyl isomerase [Planctomycetota bacterium]
MSGASLLPILLAALCLPGACGPAAASASSDAAAPATQEPPAAPQEKLVAAANDPIETIKKFIDEKKIDKSNDKWKTRLPKPPQLTFDDKKTYYWSMETNKGTIKIKLLPKIAPMHVSSCIYLNTLGFYDGLKFHRVIKGFMAQGGCPLGKGHGNPGYQMRIEISPDVKHSKVGILSTARTQDPTTDGSQFFLTFGPTPSLDGQYTIYGEAVDGLDAIKKIEACGRASDPAPPTEELVITKGSIVVE